MMKSRKEIRHRRDDLMTILKVDEWNLSRVDGAQSDPSQQLS